MFFHRQFLFLSIIGSLFCLGLIACDDAPEAPTEAVAEADAGNAEAPSEGEPKAAAEGEAVPTDAKADLPLRRFIEVKGDVTLDGKKAEVGTEIPATATIEAAAGAHAIITLVADGLIEVREKTQFKVGTSKRKKDSLRLLAGALWSFVPTGSSYEVETHNTVAGVRGTVFYMEARSQKKTYICACDGEVEIVGAGKKGFKKTPKSKMGHVAFVIDSKGKKTKGKKAKREGHTDAEKDALMKAAAPAAE